MVWRLGESNVEQVREELSSKDLPAYNTVQTVLNRLVDREMLVRAKQGRAFLYSPALGESDYLERALGERLASATPEARKAALMNLVDQLDPGEVDEVAKRANSIRRRRSKSS